MSKRFGRNQRRRMREELVRQQITAAHLERQLYDALAKLREARAEIEDAKHVAGFMSILFPPPVISDGRPRADREKWWVALPSRLSFDAMEREFEDHALPMRAAPLPLLISRIHQDALQQAVHLRVQFGEHETCYGASALALATMPRARVHRLIADQIAQDLARKIDARRRW